MPPPSAAPRGWPSSSISTGMTARCMNMGSVPRVSCPFLRLSILPCGGPAYPHGPSPVTFLRIGTSRGAMETARALVSEGPRAQATEWRLEFRSRMGGALPAVASAQECGSMFQRARTDSSTQTSRLSRRDCARTLRRHRPAAATKSGRATASSTPASSLRREARPTQTTKGPKTSSSSSCASRTAPNETRLDSV